MLLAFLFTIVIGCGSDSSPKASKTTEQSSETPAGKTAGGPAVKPSDRQQELPEEKPDDEWVQLNSAYGPASKTMRRDQSGKCYVERNVGARRNRIHVECTEMMNDPAWSKCIDGDLKKGLPSGKCKCFYESVQKGNSPAPCPTVQPVDNKASSAGSDDGAAKSPVPGLAPRGLPGSALKEMAPASAGAMKGMPAASPGVKVAPAGVKKVAPAGLKVAPAASSGAKGMPGTKAAPSAMPSLKKAAPAGPVKAAPARPASK